MKELLRNLITGIMLIAIPFDVQAQDFMGEENFFGGWRSDLSASRAENVSNSDQPDDQAGETILAEIVSWTVTRTDYREPETFPEVDFRPDSYFAEYACSSHALCPAMGAYRDGLNRITLHEKYRDLARIDARAMLVHEIVHLLQDQSGQWTHDGCRSWVGREREAYLLQRRFLIAKGGFSPHALRLPSISEADCESRPKDHIAANQ